MLRSLQRIFAVLFLFGVPACEAATYNLPTNGKVAVAGPIPADGFYATVGYFFTFPPHPIGPLPYYLLDFNTTVSNSVDSTSINPLITNAPGCHICLFRDNEFEPLFIPGGVGDVLLTIVTSIFNTGGGSLYGPAPTVHITITVPNDLTVTPIPAALPLFATGLGLLGYFGYRRKSAQRPLTRP